MQKAITIGLSVLGLGSMALGCESHPPTHDQAPLANVTQAVQDGYADSKDPAVVGIYTQNGFMGGTCTGSLIAPNVVLTAHHCVARVASGAIQCGASGFGNPYSPSSFTITTQPKIGSGTRYRVREVRVAPGANDVCGFDIALLILSSNVSSVSPLIPRVDVSPLIDEPYSAVGFGETCPGCNDSGSRRRRDELLVSCSTGAQCSTFGIKDSEWYGDIGAVCSGDSGGPAIDAHGRVFGVVSRGGQVGDKCVGNIYSRVDQWKDFIVQAAKDGAARGAYEVPAWAKGESTGPAPVPSPNGTGGSATVDACTACAKDAFETTCLSHVTACRNSRQCPSFMQCVQGCQDDACKQACEKKYPDGARLSAAFDECLCKTACPTECVSECGGSSGTPDNPPTVCSQCVDTAVAGSCKTQVGSCRANADCAAFTKCSGECKDDACINSCTQQYPQGSNLYNEFIACVCSSACTSECAAECGDPGSPSNPPSAGPDGGRPGSSPSSDGGIESSRAETTPAAQAGTSPMLVDGSSSASGNATGTGASGTSKGGASDQALNAGEDVSSDSSSCSASGRPYRGHSIPTFAMILALAAGVFVQRRTR